MAVLEGEIKLAGNDGITKDIENGQIASVNSSGVISVNKLLNPADYLQFIFKYEVEPFAYAPENVGDKLEKISRLAVVDPSEKTTACELNEMVTPERFLESIENRDPSCLVKINPNILPDGKWNIWAKLIKADANFALGDVETGRQILNEIPGIIRQIIC